MRKRADLPLGNARCKFFSNVWIDDLDVVPCSFLSHLSIRLLDELICSKRETAVDVSILGGLDNSILSNSSKENDSVVSTDIPLENFCHSWNLLACEREHLVAKLVSIFFYYLIFIFFCAYLLKTCLFHHHYRLLSYQLSIYNK